LKNLRNLLKKLGIFNISLINTVKDLRKYLEFRRGNFKKEIKRKKILTLFTILLINILKIFF
jgi:hypothetical protein